MSYLKIEVDEVRQREALAGSAPIRWLKARISARDWTTPLISLIGGACKMHGWDGDSEGARVEVEWCGGETSFCASVLRNIGAVFIRPDEHGQLEVCGGCGVVAKIFVSSPPRESFHSGLLHAEFSGNSALELQGRIGVKARLAKILGTERNRSPSPLAMPTDLGAISGLLNLVSIACHASGPVYDLGPLKDLGALVSIELAHCEPVSDLSPLRGLKSLKSLTIENCGSVVDLEPISSLVLLTTLVVTGARQISDLTPMASLTELASLAISGCGRVVDLRALSGLTNLTSLAISDFDQLVDLGPLSGLRNLTSLVITDCPNVENIDPLCSLQNLESLVLSNCKGVSNLAPLSSLPRLQSLNHSGCIRVTDVSFLSSLINLVSLDASDCFGIADLGAISDLRKLSVLDVSGCHTVADLASLSTLSSLVTLSIARNDTLSSVKPLVRLGSLCDLDASGCPNVSDAEELAHCRSLRVLKLDETAIRDSVLLAASSGRGHLAVADRLLACLKSFSSSKNPALHSRRMANGVEWIARCPSTPGLSVTFREVTKVFRARGGVPPEIWTRFLATLLWASDPTFRGAFEVSLRGLPVGESRRVLAPALAALADAPKLAAEWAVDLGRRALKRVRQDPEFAREVAPVAVQFFHAHRLDVEAMEWTGSVAG